MSKPQRRSTRHQKSDFRLETLESRLLYSADLAQVASIGLPEATEHVAMVQNEGGQVAESALSESDNTDASQLNSTSELVVIDSGSPDLDSLLADFENRTEGPRVVVLEAGDDALGRLGELIGESQGLTTVHLFSHGADGELELGGERITTLDLLSRSQDIAAWRGAFVEGADFLIYGCDVAASADGKAFVDTLARLSGADVAASIDRTGGERALDNWVLEYRHGAIEGRVAVSDYFQESFKESFATYTVSTLADSGAGSLRNAIDLANASGTNDVIEFSVSGIINLANVSGSFSTITDTVTIDGTTAPGYIVGTPSVVINGSALTTGKGFLLGAGSDGSIIRGLSIQNIPGEAIEIRSSGNIISGNYIGNDGTNAAANGTGISIFDSTGNVIGGDTVAERNVISGNDTSAVYIAGGSANYVQGNYIGTTADGNTLLANGGRGVALVNTFNNVIGGDRLASEGNVISGNATLVGSDPDHAGVSIRDATTTGNRIEGNLIGTDRTGTIGIGNSIGVRIYAGATGNTIGGNNQSGLGNVISGNSNAGVEITGSGTDSNRIVGNVVGLNLGGTSAVGNLGKGVLIEDGAVGTVVGSPATGEGNVISGNFDDGIDINGSGTTGTIVQANIVGLYADGITRFANSNDEGIQINNGASDNQIGGDADAGEGNVVSGNDDHGIVISGAGSDRNTVLGNIIGLDKSGVIALQNDNHGVYIFDGALGTIVGGDRGDGHGNVISGNGGRGIFIYDGDNTAHEIYGNIIGLNAAGTDEVANGDAGIYIERSNGNIIGGSLDGYGNIVSGNVSHGIHLEVADYPSKVGNELYGNLIGTDITGTLDKGNGGAGVYVFFSYAVVIGGELEGAGNVISGNTQAGIHLDNADEGLIKGNYIGTSRDESVDIGNGAQGILIETSSLLNVIGGTTAAAANTIRANTGAGISVIGSGSLSNALLRNVITGNGGLGIDLGTSGVQSNDTNDPDGGPNRLQNYPVLTKAEADGAGSILIEGSVDSTGNTDYRLDFFASTTGDGSGHGQAERYLGTAAVSTDAAGDATFSETLTAPLWRDEAVTALLTRLDGVGLPLDTSEFSANFTATSLNVAPTDLVEERTFDQAILINDGAANNQYFLASGADSLLGGLGDFTIKGVITQTVDGGNHWFSYGPSNDLLIGTSASGSASEIEIHMGVGVGDRWDTGVDTTLIADGDPHEWIITRTSADGGISLYIDGQLKASQTGYKTGSTVSTGGLLVLGQEQDTHGGNFDPIQIHDGTYADIAIYNTAWDAATVAANTGRLTADTADRIAHWDFNTMTAGVVDDQEGARDLTLTTITGVGWVDGDASVVGSAYDLNILENSVNGSTVAKITGVDLNAGGALTYEITSQDIVGAFSIDENTGIVTVANETSMNYEATNTQDITIEVSDGEFTYSETFVIQLVDANESPIISSNGGGATAALSVVENQTVVTTVTSTDPESNTVTYSITGGDDSALFDIDLNSGELTFDTARNFETPTDFDTDGVYDVEITAADGNGGDDSQLVSVTITNVNDVPTFGSSLDGAPTYAEDGSAVLFDQNVVVSDDELDLLNGGSGNYAGSTLILVRDGGANSNDVISFNDGNGITSSGSTLIKNSAVIASFDTSTTAGELVVVFTDANTEIPTSTNVANILSQLTYSNTLDVPPASVTINWTFDDGNAGAQGSGGSGVENGSTVVTVTAVNDKPTFSTSTVTTAVFVEGGEAVLLDPNILVADSELDQLNGGNGNYSGTVLTVVRNAGANSDDVMSFVNDNGITLTDSTLVKNSNAIASFDTMTTAGELIVTFTDANGEIPTSADVDNVLRQLSYANSSDSPPATVQISGTFNDGNTGSQGTGGSSQTASSITVSIQEAPDLVITAPAAATTDEDTVFVFSGANVVQVTDGITADVPLSVSLSVANGALSLASVNGITFVEGADGDATMVIEGLESDINIALNGLEFLPDTDYHGSDTLSIAVAIAADLQAHYAFENNALDESAGTLNNGTLEGGVGFVDDGERGNVLSLDGIDDGILISPDIAFTNQVTLSAWVNVPVTNSNEGFIVSLGNNVWLNVYGNGSVGGSYRDAAGGSWSRTTDNQNIEGTGWRHLTYTVDSIAQVQRIYVDGKLTAETTYSNGIFQNPNDHVIGRNTTVGQNLFGGLIDDTRIYSRALSTSEVAALATDQISVTDSVPITVNSVNDAPAISSSATFSVVENNTVVGQVVATDVDIPADTLSYSISGGADSALFSIDASGNLSFQSEPDFDNPSDADTDNDYVVEVQVSDGAGGNTTQTITVSVTDVNESPVISSSATFSVVEDTTAVGQVVATDNDVPADTLSYSISGGADNALFSIDASGNLSFQAAPNFDNPSDANTDNDYVVEVQVSDGAGGNTTQTITVSVTDVNEAPVISSANTFSVVENNTAVGQVVATDNDVPADTLSYSISGGADGALFSIDASGNLSFQSAPDFDNPSDANTDNDYVVEVQVSDGAGGNTTQTITVSVTDVNESPVISSSATFSVVENTTTIGQVVATDNDVPADTLSYSISGGADSALFSIDASGNLSFQSAPDFDNPTDADTDNDYVVEVQVSDSQGGNTTQTITVSVTDVNETPVISSTNTFSVVENNAAVGQVVATDNDVPMDTLSYSISGGADSALFSIDASGNLSFQLAPDFDNPSDANTDNDYVVEVQVSDGAGGNTTQTTTVSVTDVNEAPVISSSATFSVVENTTNVGEVVATDNDVPADTLSYSISGGADSALFSIDASGNLSFQAAQDFDNPSDANTDNDYVVEVQVSDGAGGNTTQTITVSVTDMNEVPVISSSATFSVVDETINNKQVIATDSDVPADTLSYTIIGGADSALFSINTIGNLSFHAAPDFDNPPNANFDNDYLVVVQVSDGRGGAVTQAITVSVTDINEAPRVVADMLVAREDTPLLINPVLDLLINDLDPEGGDLRLDEFDQPGFGTLINLQEGLLEYRPDADFNGLDHFNYTVIDEAGNTASARVAINVEPVNDSPVLSPGADGGNEVTPGVIDAAEVSDGVLNIVENANIAGQVVASDVDGDTFSFSLAGPDSALFEINTSTGELRPIQPLDFEAPRDGDGNNRYDLEILVTDVSGDQARIPLSVTAVDTNEPPLLIESVFTLDEGYSGELGRLMAVDVDNGDELVFELGNSGTAGQGVRVLADGRVISDGLAPGNYELEVLVRDSGNLVSIGFVTVRVESLADSTPPLGSALPGGTDTVDSVASPPAGVVQATVTYSAEAAAETEAVAKSAPIAVAFLVSPATVEVQSLELFESDNSAGLIPNISDLQQVSIVFQERSSQADEVRPGLPIFDDVMKTLLPEPGQLLNLMELIRTSIDDMTDKEEAAERRMTLVVAFGGVTLSIGLAAWLIASRVLVAVAFSTAALWSPIDPVPVLLGGHRDDEEDEDADEDDDNDENNKAA
ncbi:MAG: cadherin domain-containing protein [Granulosicoccus sp.]